MIQPLKEFAFSCWKKIQTMIYFRKLSVPNGDNKTHKEYLRKQLERSLIKKGVDTSKRVTHLINLLNKKVKVKGKDVLCVGSRTNTEINYFKRLQPKSVVGIDLFSQSKDILVMDMHSLKFPKDNFDIIFSCHSFEHSRNYKKVIKGFMKVIRPGGVIALEVPAEYETNLVDIWDFKDLEYLKEAIGLSNIKKVIFEESKKELTSEHSGSRVLRLIFEVNK